jgi:hypothetical protein
VNFPGAGLKLGTHESFLAAEKSLDGKSGFQVMAHENKPCFGTGCTISSPRAPRLRQERQETVKVDNRHI